MWVRKQTQIRAPAAVTLITVFLVIAALYYGRVVWIPVALAIVSTFVLAPVVAGLEKLGLPRAPAAIIVVLLGLTGVSGMAWIVGNQLVEITGQLGEYRANFDRKVQSLHRGQPGKL